jgi:hypothetical protein
MSGLSRRIRGPRAPGAGGPDLPAGADPPEYLAGGQTTRGRGRVRRRLRHLGRLRELALRDLGGLVFEIHRTRGGTGGPDADRLVAEKVGRVQRIDAEARELERRLGDAAGELVLREPGIGGSCPACGELYGSEARFCSSCGTPVVGRAGGSDRPPTLRERDAVEAGGS